MSEQLIVTMTRRDLETVIEERVRFCIERFTPQPKAQPVRPEHPDFLTKRQVAKMLSCGISTVDNYRRAGKLKPYYLGQKNGTVRFKKDEVLELIGGN